LELAALGLEMSIREKAREDWNSEPIEELSENRVTETTRTSIENLI
jgi:hypothetical protein